MKLQTKLLFIVTHSFVGLVGFAAGIYLLPIITAPNVPTQLEITQASQGAMYTGYFDKNLQDSDFLHWGEGEVSISDSYITFSGELAPGPDYKLYLSAEFVETEADFLRLKDSMLSVGEVNTFNNFIVKLPSDIQVSNYTSVIVWCESFGQFITAAKYR
ncbi:DM13 domain-containing protein [Catenovulum agarivorans]|uniref:DM13 domain-containing protein n=1 Tax=Catenovulum agarivorans TaxID=1172192 RepID=UPI0004753220|nr:DM13 domain-containing protein [Catenovulum agarivorans]